MPRKKLTQKKFEDRSNSKHGLNEYNYLESEVNGINNFVWIIHNKCGCKFKQTPSSHMKGNGCPKCGALSRANKQRSNIINFTIKMIYKFPEKISLYGYWNSNYINRNTRIDIFCYKCQDYFKQTPCSHFNGNGCPKCANVKKPNTIEFVIKMIYKFPEKIGLFNYKNSKYENAITLINIFCYKCQDYFKQTPSEHLSGQGCAKCNLSKGESKINCLLKYNKINFESQKRFDACKNIKPLPFDFYLTDYNILIEFDGSQHFEPHSFGINKTKEKKQKNLELVQFKDNIKIQYCLNNNIPLIRISYKEQHLIEEKINKLIKFLKTNII